jgi:Fe-S-cluster containining protein
MGFFFRCNACGRCCNSPPLMTVAELFEHQSRFVGCIAITRRPRSAGGERISIATQGLDSEAGERCPALSVDGLCSIHSSRPAICAAVPLDPALSDTLQKAVLAARSADKTYIDADCISRTPREGYAPLTSDDAIVDAGFAQAAARRRAAAALDQKIWGERLLPGIREQIDALPPPTSIHYLTIPLVPILGLFAAISPASVPRCLLYVDSQLALIASKLQTLSTSATPRATQLTGELRNFQNAYARFRVHLAGMQQKTPNLAAENTLSRGLKIYR